MSGTDPAEMRLVRLARELAMDLSEVPVILKRVGVTAGEWARLQSLPKFQQILSAEAAAWESALNTAERVKLKSAAIIEDWLDEAVARMHDRSESLAMKTEVAKLVARLAGLGIERASEGTGAGGEKFSLVINIGDGRQHRVVDNVNVIEARPN